MSDVLLAGDSTVAACPPHEAPMSGWGAHLATHLTGTVVHNFAKGGATTASHRAEGLWDALLWQLRPGDVVVLQFGHNDQKLPELASDGAYRENLARMVGEVRERGGRPVLCTSVQRRLFDGDVLEESHRDYPQAVRDLATAQGVPLIDLAAQTTTLYTNLGAEGSRTLFTQFPPGVHPNYPDGIEDNTHFSSTGANAVAALVANSLRPLLR